MSSSSHRGEMASSSTSRQGGMLFPSAAKMQMMMYKRKIDSGRGPENTAVKTKLNSPVDISESDELILVHTSFFCNF